MQRVVINKYDSNLVKCAKKKQQLQCTDFVFEHH